MPFSSEGKALAKVHTTSKTAVDEEFTGKILARKARERQTKANTYRKNMITVDEPVSLPSQEGERLTHRSTSQISKETP